MAIDGTYSGLQASIADWLNRGDLTAAIPDFIALCEGEISDRLVIEGAPRQMLGRAGISLDDEYELTPSDFFGARAFYIAGATDPLEYVDPEKIAERKILYPSVTGNPQVYSVVGNEFQFWPAPVSPTPAELTYLRRIPQLSTSAPGNWLLTFYPDAYLFGALIQSAPYLKEDDRLPLWQQKFDGIISRISLAGKRAQEAPHLALSINPSVV